jgi:hypothetical protein
LIVIATVSGGAADAEGETFDAAPPPLLDPHAAVAANSAAVRTRGKDRIAITPMAVLRAEHASGGRSACQKRRDR